MTDPDSASWRAWLAYRDSTTGKDHKAPKRNAGAYLNLFTGSGDRISIDEIRKLASEPRDQHRGGGGQILWDRACRYLRLRERLVLDPDDPEGFVNAVFDPDAWIGSDNADPNVAKQDMQLLLDKAMALLKESKEESRDFDSEKQDPIAQVAKRLRYQIATREPFVVGEGIDLQVATLWGAKGVTADHVYVLGLCKATIPGERREEYPGTDLDFYERQRRLFYVSLTRSKRTLVLSRAQYIQRTNAIRMGLGVAPGKSPTATLEMCPFLRDIINFLPKAVPGDKWPGVVG
jgi:hypothetical protein